MSTTESESSSPPPTISNRGILVVVEGLDRSGKSTQTRLLAEALAATTSSELWKYPNRETELGHIIDKYLRKQVDMDDRAVHLLFSANRWEMCARMQERLNAGVNLIVDRYAYSGVAYSAAKPGMDFEWCKQCDAGLIKPDLLVFMDTQMVRLEQREGFGEERYENVEFQAKVYENFKKLLKLEKDSSNQLVLNAKETIETLHLTILNRVKEIIDSKKLQINGFSKLW